MLSNNKKEGEAMEKSLLEIMIQIEALTTEELKQVETWVAFNIGKREKTDPAQKTS